MMDAPMWRLIHIALLLPCLVLPLTVPPEKLFAGWLFVAPFVAGASAGPHHGHAFFKYLFLVPPLILLARMAMGEIQRPRLWMIDVLPALYLGYILVRARLLPSDLAGAESSLRAIYTTVGIGTFAYYFTAFGKTSNRLPSAVAKTLLSGGVVIAALAVVDGSTGWNLWHNDVTGGDQVRRAVATFTSPEALGAYLGAGVAFAVAILLWHGPRSLRGPALLLIGLSIPALYLTYTRGPIIAIAAVVVSMTVVANRARWPSLLVFATVGILLFASWSQISSRRVYQQRLGVTTTVDSRVVLSDVALDLFRRQPLFGQGYNTFDKAKLTVAVPGTADTAIVQNLTSHDTFLTVLAESGAIGLALLVLPWVVIGWRAVAAGQRGLLEPWIVGGCVGTVAAFAIGSVTYDSRFFPYTSALPWVALGLVRKLLAERQTGAESA